MNLALIAGRPVTGLWCDHCSLPSRYEVAVYVLLENGPCRLGLANRCDGCAPEGGGL